MIYKMKKLNLCFICELIISEQEHSQTLTFWSQKHNDYVDIDIHHKCRTKNLPFKDYGLSEHYRRLAEYGYH